MKKFYFKFLTLSFLSTAVFSCRNNTQSSKSPKLDIDMIQKSRGTLNLNFPSEEQIAGKQEYSSKTLIISLKNTSTENEVIALANEYDLEMLYFYRNFNMYALSAKKELTDTEMAELIEKIKADSRVDYVERDGIIHLD